MKTLKHEEVHRNEYRDLAEARASIHQFLEKVYTGSGCIRRSVTGHLPSSKHSTKRKPLRGSFLYEFFKA